MMGIKHTFVSGIGDDPNAAAAGEVLPSHWNADHDLSGLALTGDVTSAGTVTTLSTTGVTAGSYGSNVNTPVITVDAKGRLTSVSTVTSAPLFASIQSKPNTLAGYGINAAASDLTNGTTGLGAIVLATNAALTNPTANTQIQNDNSTKVATTAYADRIMGTFGRLAEDPIVVNGDFSADQRNNGAAVTVVGASTYVVDNWQDTSTNATLSCNRQLEAFPNLEYSYKRDVTVRFDPTTNATNVCALTHFIEAYKLAMLGWGFGNPYPFVLSFEVKSTTTGIYPVAVQNLLSPTRRSYVSSYQITAPNQWQRFELPVPVDGASALGNAATAAGLALRFSLGSGSQWQVPTAGLWTTGDFFTTATSVPFVNFAGAQNWNIRRVKITPGSAGTLWTVPSPPLVLTESQRYFENGYYQFDTGNGANAVSLSIPFDTKKRITPSMTVTMVQGTLTSVTATQNHLVFTGTSAANGVVEFNWAASAVM
jgi:hypothetical protein